MGCQPDSREPAKPLPTSQPVMERKWDEEPIVVRQAGPIAVKAGTPPLFYMCDSGGHIRVSDQTAATVLAEISAPRGTIVSVDVRQGVRVGEEQVLAGPLEADHRYTIYLQPDSNSVLQRGALYPK